MSFRPAHLAHRSGNKRKTEQNVSSIKVKETLTEVYEGCCKQDKVEEEACGCRVVFSSCVFSTDFCFWETVFWFGFFFLAIGFVFYFNGIYIALYEWFGGFFIAWWLTQTILITASLANAAISSDCLWSHILSFMVFRGFRYFSKPQRIHKTKLQQY